MSNLSNVQYLPTRKTNSAIGIASFRGGSSSCKRQTTKSWDISSYFWSLLRIHKLYHEPILIQFRVVSDLCPPVLITIEKRFELGPKNNFSLLIFAFWSVSINLLVQPSKTFGPTQNCYGQTFYSPVLQTWAMCSVPTRKN